MRHQPGSMRRRDFLQGSTAVLGALAVAPGSILLDPYRPAPARRGPRPPVRIRGRVTAAGRGVGGAAVSDGLAVAGCDADGGFELVSTGGPGFVSVIPPAGYRLPAGPTGSLALHRPIRPDDAGEMTVSFDLVPGEGGDERHAFLVLADPQTQDAREMARFHAETVPDVQATVRGLGRPAFGVGCGDLMYDDLTLFPDYERGIQAMGIPFAQVVGNHDLDMAEQTDEGSVTTFASRFGPNRYAFNVGRVHYVVLDDVLWHGSGYIGYLDAGQLAWLAADLARVERGAPVVVFLHIPAFSSEFQRRGQRSPAPSIALTNREALYRLLEPFRAHVISGHMHESDHVYEGGVHEYTVGAVCGAWWTGDICYDGTPNGYGVFAVEGEELRWRYQATGRPADYQLRAYLRRSDPSEDAELSANVWNWDPRWTVVWYEGGDRRGAMERRVGLDPLSVALHDGPTLPARRTWVDPMPTGHMFYADPGAGVAATEIRVEATDPWGGVFTASPARPG